MRSFASLTLNPKILLSNLMDLEHLLSSDTHLRERDQVIPFFATKPHLCTALRFANNAVELPDRWAKDLDLFGDFVCDVAAGDSEANAYTLIEFEDARRYGIFSPRFEHGFSQLVDWAWRLPAEGDSSAAFRRIFGGDNPAVRLLLIVGRDADLTRDGLARLRWRAKHISLGQFRMSCFTFDGVLQSIRRRLLWAGQPVTAT